MNYRHIHYLNFEPGVEENVILDAAVKLAEEGKQPKFFLKVAAFLCKHTKAEFVGIGLLDEDNAHVTTCILLHEEMVMENITYTLKGTPCDEVFMQKFCYYPYRVKDHFPDDKLLQRMNIQSYLGTLLLSPAGKAIGVVELFSTKQIEHPAFAEHLILILSPAIEEELLRQQTKYKRDR